MNCKSCGYTIPSTLLNRESFTCPNCGKAYRRNGSGSAHSQKPTKAQNTTQSRKSDSSTPRRSASPRSASGAGTPRLLFPILTGVLALALVICCILLLTGRSSENVFSVCGIIGPGSIEKNKAVTSTIEIPKQRDNNYIIATETDTSGVTLSIKNKTSTSFDLVTRNTSSKSRSPIIQWVLIPHREIAED